MILRCAICIALLTAICSMQSTVVAASVEPLNLSPLDLSRNGQAVVGHTGDWARWNSSAAFWTPVRGVVEIGYLPSFAGDSGRGRALSVSDDGRVIVGTMQSVVTQSIRSFVHHVDTGLTAYMPLDRGYRAALVSGDGLTVIGTAPDDSAFRWSPGAGVQMLGTLGGPFPETVPYDVDSSGDVIVGYGQSTLGIDPFRWTNADGMTSLRVDSGWDAGAAIAVSAAGGDAVGVSGENEGMHWDAVGTGRRLPPLEGYPFSFASGLSGDATRIVGHSRATTSAPWMTATVWNAALEAISLEELLADSGIDVSGWAHLYDADLISNDGNVIVGIGRQINASADSPFIVVLPEPGAIAWSVVGAAVVLRRDTSRRVGRVCHPK